MLPDKDLPMQRTPFRDMHCSLARSLDVIGEWWSPLIVRDLNLGLTRFDQLQEDLGISAKVLSERLRTLVAAGVVDRKPYQTGPRRDSYLLTAKGRALVPPLLALMAWGDRWASPDGKPPLLLRHERCGRFIEPRVVCSRCGVQIESSEVTPVPGPGGAQEPGTMLIAEALAASPRPGRARGKAAPLKATARSRGRARRRA
jgi:DNA-binding HxlR family transcriptional regulator